MPRGPFCIMNIPAWSNHLACKDPEWITSCFYFANRTTMLLDVT